MLMSQAQTLKLIYYTHTHRYIENGYLVLHQVALELMLDLISVRVHFSLQGAHA